MRWPTCPVVIATTSLQPNAKPGLSTPASSPLSIVGDDGETYFSDDAPTLPPLPSTVLQGEGNIGNDEIDITTPFPNWPTPASDPAWFLYQGQMMSLQRQYYSGPWRFAGTHVGFNNQWPLFLHFTPTFALQADRSFWIKVYYNQTFPTREARPSVARLLTVNP
jgi:hypothetical protein